MSRVITTRLDEATAKMLAMLARRLGWKESRIVREGIKALRAALMPKLGRNVVGLGQIRSGLLDLGSNKAHLKGFGH